MTKEEYYFWLGNIALLSFKKKYLLLDFFHTPESVYKAGEKELSKIKGINEKDIDLLLNKQEKEQSKRDYDSLGKNEIIYLSKEKEEYPEKLRNIYQPPLGLYIKGKLPAGDRITIAVIGARVCSGYGKEMAKYFAGEMAKMGVQVISGLAKGIDSHAHQGVLAVGASTFGILGCGIDICYPKENFEIYKRMDKNGGILSEYGMGVPPLPHLFPMRNRIISGLSDGILVIEAREKSGSLITADWGLEQGKDIYALPGRATESLSTGCNNLIKAGAKLVTTPEDILEDFMDCVHYLENGLKKNNNMLETKEKIVYASLSFNPKHLEKIMQETKMDLKTVMGVLFGLQIKNLVKQNGNYYSYMTST